MTPPAVSAESTHYRAKGSFSSCGKQPDRVMRTVDGRLTLRLGMQVRCVTRVRCLVRAVEQGSVAFRHALAMTSLRIAGNDDAMLV